MSESVRRGEGYAVARLDDLGEGPGFRKMREVLGVTAFGVNAIAMPPGFETGFHYHERQEELYVCLRGQVRIRFGDGEGYDLEAGDVAWVAPEAHRSVGNPGPDDGIYLIVGGADGYVGRDGRMPEGETRGARPISG